MIQLASFQPRWHIIMIANVNYLCHALNHKIVALHIPEEKYRCMDGARKKTPQESTERLLLSFTSAILETLL